MSCFMPVQTLYWRRGLSASFLLDQVLPWNSKLQSCSKLVTSWKSFTSRFLKELFKKFSQCNLPSNMAQNMSFSSSSQVSIHWNASENSRPGHSNLLISFAMQNLQVSSWRTKKFPKVIGRAARTNCFFQTPWAQKVHPTSPNLTASVEKYPNADPIFLKPIAVS